MLKRILLAIAFRILKHYGALPTATKVIEWPGEIRGAKAYVYLAAQKVREQEAMNSGASGEAKRHQVYSAMLKAYPTARKRDIAMAIEFAQQGK